MEDFYKIWLQYNPQERLSAEEEKRLGEKIQTGKAVREKMKKTGASLSKEEEKVCIEGNTALKKLILCNIPLGIYFANKYAAKYPEIGLSLDDISQTLSSLQAGLLRSESCNVLQVECSEGLCGYPFALNEVAVLKRDDSSMISIHVSLGGQYLTTYQADGLIVNTPTGSTGYALSVGGPVMLPGSQIVGLVPVAPHGLTARPLTLPDDIEVTLTVESRNHNFLVAIDGRSEPCQDTACLTIRKAPYQIVVLKRPETTFLDTLRSKLLWGSDTRTSPSPSLS